MEGWEFALVLECGEFLDGFEDLLLSGVDPELVGLMAEDDGIPNEGVCTVLRIISPWGQGDEEFEHPEDAAEFEVASEPEVFEGGDVSSGDTSNAI